jgi:predicted transcriptional regulator with HTH domain
MKGEGTVEPAFKGYNLKGIIIGLIFGLVGVVVLISVESIDRHAHPVWYYGLVSVGSVLALGGLLQLSYEFQLRRELISEFEKAVKSVTNEIRRIRADVDDRVNLSQALGEVGLVEVGPNESEFNYSQMLKNAKKLYFVFNDGRTWFSRHEYHLHERARDANLQTIIIVADPRSPFLPALAHKVDQTIDELRQKIDQTVKMMGRIGCGNDNIKVFSHMMPTSYSLIMSEERAAFIPYPMSNKADRIPCIIFDSCVTDGFYGVLDRDIKGLLAKEDTRQLFPQQLV